MNWTVCPECGTANYPRSTVCRKCGLPIETAGPDGANTRPYIISGFILAFLSCCFVCCCPMVFAIPAMLLGLNAYGKGDRLGIWVVIAALAPTLIWSTLLATGILTPDWTRRSP